MFGLGFDAKQKQTQTANAATILEARIIQAAGPDLDAIIAEALAENPFLTDGEADADTQGETDRGLDGSQDPTPEETPMELLDAPMADTDPDHWEPAASGGEGQDGDAFLDGAAEPAGGLREHLLAQLPVARLTPGELVVARLLIGELDDAGYLRVDLGEAAKTLGVAREQVEDVRDVLRGLEPSGAFAADLEECLALQAADRGVLDDAMKAVLFRLEMVASGRIAEIASRSGQPAAKVRERIAQLKTFDPRPGLRYGAPTDPPGPPELLVDADGAGGWRARLNPDAFPHLSADRESRDGALAVCRGDDRSFVQDRWREAQFLLRALIRREDTLRRLGAFIAQRQRAFFDCGASHLAPVRQSEAAEALSLHASTISRALAGKRLRCPRGIFDLASFFPGAVSEETDQSADAVKARIRALIDGEDAASPLSDDAIAERLKSEGRGVARRTVAKYREAMGLAPARRRGRLKVG